MYITTPTITDLNSCPSAFGRKYVTFQIHMMYVSVPSRVKLVPTALISDVSAVVMVTRGSAIFTHTRSRLWCERKTRGLKVVKHANMNRESSCCSMHIGLILFNTNYWEFICNLMWIICQFIHNQHVFCLRHLYWWRIGLWLVRSPSPAPIAASCALIGQNPQSVYLFRKCSTPRGRCVIHTLVGGHTHFRYTNQLKVIFWDKWDFKPGNHFRACWMPLYSQTNEDIQNVLNFLGGPQFTGVYSGECTQKWYK